MGKTLKQWRLWLLRWSNFFSCPFELCCSCVRGGLAVGVELFTPPLNPGFFPFSTVFFVSVRSSSNKSYGKALAVPLKKRALFRKCLVTFFRITQYIGDTHNARTLIPMNTRTQTLPLGASSKTVPANPQD
jgi:hypothetical protein